MGKKPYPDKAPTVTELSTKEYRQKLEARKADLERKLKARDRQTAFRDNVPELKAEIAKLDRILASLDDPANIK